MRKNQSSITAMGIAVLRAVESEKPENERICFDPYARLFLPGWFYYLTRFFITTGYAERRGKGVIGFLAARERYIDDFLAASLAEGIDQLVILGAGYDSRAYRLKALCPEAKTDICVFEVDHPATQPDKLAGVSKIFGALPRHISYVAVDFDHQTLAGCLAAYQYDPRAKTVFIWQGVTYYLDPLAVEGTLDFIAHNAKPGSSVIFDYIDEALLASPDGHGEVRGMNRYREMTGEELRYGIPLTEIEALLTRVGFTQVKNIRSEDLKSQYFHGKNLSRNVTPGYGIVSAVVGERHAKGDQG